MRPHGTPQQLERRRLKAGTLLREGVRPVAVARIVGASEASVSRWRQALETGGEDALAAKPHPGRAPKISAKQQRRLLRILLAGATAEGYANELWTSKRVVEVIRRRWGVKYDPSGVWHLLRRMGLSCQKPERIARECDEEAVERWRQKDWPRIKKSR